MNWLKLLQDPLSLILLGLLGISVYALLPKLF
jgi:hypothetical protein